MCHRQTISLQFTQHYTTIAIEWNCVNRCANAVGWRIVFIVVRLLLFLWCALVICVWWGKFMGARLSCVYRSASVGAVCVCVRRCVAPR